MKGWGPKSSVFPLKPGKSNFFGGKSRDFAGISRGRPKSLNKKVCVQSSSPNFLFWGLRAFQEGIDFTNLGGRCGYYSFSSLRVLGKGRTGPSPFAGRRAVCRKGWGLFEELEGGKGIVCFRKPRERQMGGETSRGDPHGKTTSNSPHLSTCCTPHPSPAIFLTNSLSRNPLTCYRLISGLQPKIGKDGRKMSSPRSCIAIWGEFFIESGTLWGANFAQKIAKHGGHACLEVTRKNSHL